MSRNITSPDYPLGWYKPMRIAPSRLVACAARALRSCSPGRRSTSAGRTSPRTSGSCSAPRRSRPRSATPISVAARRRRDARLFLISLAFIASAGFLGLHALATPGVLLGKNAGFELATPFGLLLAGVFAAASATRARAGRGALRSCGAREPPARRRSFGVMVAWAVVSLAELPPLDEPARRRAARRLAARARRRRRRASTALAALGYFRLYRRRPAALRVRVRARVRAPRRGDGRRSRGRATGSSRGGSGTCSCSARSSSSA